MIQRGAKETYASCRLRISLLRTAPIHECLITRKSSDGGQCPFMAGLARYETGYASYPSAMDAVTLL